MNSKSKTIAALVLAILLPQLAGLLGAFATADSVSTWYVDELNKPAFTPPGFVFPIVWPMLYLFMGIASWQVWKELGAHPLATKALWLYGIQLALNTLWSFLFFGMKMPGLAFIEILLLWVFIALTMLYFFKIRRPAGWLFVPYLLWVSFASVLNGTIWWMN